MMNKDGVKSNTMPGTSFIKKLFSKNNIKPAVIVLLAGSAIYFGIELQQFVSFEKKWYEHDVATDDVKNANFDNILRHTVLHITENEKDSSEIKQLVKDNWEFEKIQLESLHKDVAKLDELVKSADQSVES